jgi:hypothetical protein
MSYVRASWTAVLVAASISSILPLEAGIIRHDRPVEKYQELGAAAQFQCVGEARLAREAGDRWRPSASAVLIAPQWVLTAGHVAGNAPLERQRYYFGGEEYRAIRRVMHPGVDIEAGSKRLAWATEGKDLALIQLDREVRDVQPAKRYRGMDEVGRTMTKVGYGCIGDGMRGMTLVGERPLQERRGGENVINAAGGQVQELTVSDRVLICDFDNPLDDTLNQIGDAPPVELEIGQSVGDSGGGWFIEQDGSWQLVAISSVILPNKGEPRNTNVPKYGVLMSGMRISTANDWIDRVINGR